MKVKIHDREIELRKTMRSYIIYESMNDGKMFNLSSMTDIITYFYCIVCGSDKTLELSFNDFLDWLDENDTSMEEFMKWMKDVNDTDIPGKKKTIKTKKVKN